MVCFVFFFCIPPSLRYVNTTCHYVPNTSSVPLPNGGSMYMYVRVCTVPKASWVTRECWRQPLPPQLTPAKHQQPTGHLIVVSRTALGRGGRLHITGSVRKPLWSVSPESFNNHVTSGKGTECMSGRSSRQNGCHSAEDSLLSPAH